MWARNLPTVRRCLWSCVLTLANCSVITAPLYAPTPPKFPGPWAHPP